MKIASIETSRSSDSRARIPAPSNLHRLAAGGYGLAAVRWLRLQIDGRVAGVMIALLANLNHQVDDHFRL